MVLTLKWAIFCHYNSFSKRVSKQEIWVIADLYIEQKTKQYKIAWQYKKPHTTINSKKRSSATNSLACADLLEECWQREDNILFEEKLFVHRKKQQKVLNPALIYTDLCVSFQKWTKAPAIRVWQT